MVRRSRRRALQGMLGGLCGTLAGCSGGFDRSDRKARRLGESQTNDGTTVTVSQTAVQASFLRTLADPIWEPTRLSMRRYVFARVTVTGDPPPSPGDFQLVKKQNDDTIPGTANPEVGLNQRIHEREPRYAPADGIWSGWIAFVDDIDVPADAYIEWGSNRWTLPDAERQALGGGTPAFEYESIELPEQIRRGEPLDVRFELRNVNDTYAGVCRGALHVIQPRPSPVTPAETAQLFELDIEPGETAIWTHTFETEFTRNVSRLQLRLKSHAGDREFSVQVAD